MNDIPERDLQPSDATIVNEPDPDDYHVSAVAPLSERWQLALNEYYSGNGDIDVMALLGSEAMNELNGAQRIVNGISNELVRIARVKQAD